MTLTEIIKAAASRMSEVTVELDKAYETVCISAPGEEDIFMQGQAAAEFILRVEELWEKSGDVTEDEAALCEASTYVECLWN